MFTIFIYTTMKLDKFWKNNTNQWTYTCIILVCILSACHRNKQIAGTVTPPVNTTPPPVAVTAAVDPNVSKMLAHIKNNELPFSELAAKLKTKVSSPSLNQSFTTNIRWKKNEKIWMSMSIIGIEGARVLITKDSIKIMDKINSKYILKPLSYIKQKTYVDLSFNDIENLLLGQLLFTDSTKTKYANNATNYALSSDGIRFLTSILLDKKSQLPTNILITDKKYSQTVESTYSNYQLQMGKMFAMDRDLKIKSGLETFQMTVKFQSIEARQNLEYPFTINSGYTIEK